MSAHLIHQLAPIGGSLVAWSDGTPRPPERHRRKLADWQTRNGQGRLIRKQDQRATASYVSSPSFTLHEGDFGSGGVIVIRGNRSFDVASHLLFTIVEPPAVGSVRVFDRPGAGAELVHLASYRAAAETWLQSHGYPRAVLDEVTADEIGALAADAQAA